MRSRARRALLLLLLTTAGCGDSSSDGSPGAGGSGAAGAAAAGTGAGGSAGARAGGTAGNGGSGAASSAGAGGRTGSAGATAGASGQAADASVDMAGTAAMDAATPDSGRPSGTPYVYVSGSGPDITRFTLDLDTGALTERGRNAGGNNPSYLAIAPDQRTLYAVNEGDDSQAIAFAIDPATGALTEINRQPTMGEGAPHLAVHPSGDYVAVAHYNSGHISILPVRADGGLEPASDVERGPSDGCVKAHQAVFDRSGQHMFVPCLGSNYVIQFDFAGGELDYNTPATAAVPGGPRHMAFGPDEQHAYVLSELESKITSFDYDAQSGLLGNPQTIDSFEAGGTKGASAHIVVHPWGDFLYASNRSENSIGLFSIDGDGRPHPVAFVRDMISTPRDFTVDPTGTFLISANQNGAQNLLVFRIDPDDGMLTRVQTVAVGGGPTFAGVAFLP